MAPRYLFERQIINLQSTLNAPCKNNLWTKPGRYKKENSVPYVTGLDWVRHLTRHDLQPHNVCYSSYAGKWCNWSEFFEMVCCGMTLKNLKLFFMRNRRVFGPIAFLKDRKSSEICVFLCHFQKWCHLWQSNFHWKHLADVACVLEVSKNSLWLAQVSIGSGCVIDVVSHDLESNNIGQLWLELSW